MIPASLAEFIASRPDRCEYGYSPNQHPGCCNCDDAEWQVFLRAVRAAAQDDGTVHQRDVRPRLRGSLDPKAIGRQWARARRERVVSEIGHERSDDRHGKNAGRMEPVYRLTP